jgi:WD40 repeat protein
VAALAALAATVTLLGAAGVAAALVWAIAGWSAAERAGAKEAEQRGRAVEALDRVEVGAYVNLVARAHQEWRLNNPAGAADLLERCQPGPGEKDRRGWEWRYLQALNHADLFTKPFVRDVADVAFTPDGRWLVAAGGVPAAPPNDDGRLAFWPADGRSEPIDLPRPSRQPFLTSVAISPDGRRLATAGLGPEIELWDLTKDVSHSRRVQTLPASTREVLRLAFSPDGRFLATAEVQQTPLIWDFRSRRWRRVPEIFCARRLAAVAFSPDGRSLAAGGANGLAIRDLDGDRDRHRFILGGVSAVAFSPDGGRLAAASGKVVLVWETASWTLLYSLNRHDGEVSGVAFSPDGLLLATSSFDRTVRVWEARDGRERLVLRGHTTAVTCVAFHPDGLRLASGARGPAEVKVWDLTAVSQEHASLPDGGEALAFGPGGRDLLTVRAGWLSARDASTARLRQRLRLGPAEGPPKVCAAFSGDGRRCVHCRASVGEPLPVEVTDLDGGPTRPLDGPLAHVVQVALSRDGRRAAAKARDLKSPKETYSVCVWDVETGRRLSTYTAGDLNYVQGIGAERVGALALSPGGECVAFDAEYTTERPAGCPECMPQVTGVRVKVYDAATGAERAALTGPGGSAVWGLAFSPDGRRLAAACPFLGPRAGSVVVWDVASGRPLHPQPLTGPGLQVAFSPDGRRLAGMDREGVAVWDVDSGCELLVLRGFREKSPSPPFEPLIAWSADGERLAATTYPGRVSIWDAGESRSPAARRREADDRAFAWRLRQFDAAVREQDRSAALWNLRWLLGDLLGRRQHLEEDALELLRHILVLGDRLRRIQGLEGRP